MIIIIIFTTIRDSENIRAYFYINNVYYYINNVYYYIKNKI